MIKAAVYKLNAIMDSSHQLHLVVDGQPAEFVFTAEQEALCSDGGEIRDMALVYSALNVYHNAFEGVKSLGSVVGQPNVFFALDENTNLPKYRVHLETDLTIKEGT